MSSGKLGNIKDAKLVMLNIGNISKRYDDNYVFNRLPLCREAHDELFNDLINNKLDNIEIKENGCKKNENCGSS